MFHWNYREYETCIIFFFSNYFKNRYLKVRAIVKRNLNSKNSSGSSELVKIIVPLRGILGFQNSISYFARYKETQVTELGSMSRNENRCKVERREILRPPKRNKPWPFILSDLYISFGQLTTDGTMANVGITEAHVVFVNLVDAAQNVAVETVSSCYRCLCLDCKQELISNAATRASRDAHPEMRRMWWI